MRIAAYTCFIIACLIGSAVGVAELHKRFVVAREHEVLVRSLCDCQTSNRDLKNSLSSASDTIERMRLEAAGIIPVSEAQ